MIRSQADDKKRIIITVVFGHNTKEKISRQLYTNNNNLRANLSCTDK